MFKIIMDHIFFVSNDVVKALKTFLENFSKNCLATVQG